MIKDYRARLPVGAECYGVHCFRVNGAAGQLSLHQLFGAFWL
jgi:hypothetical protein